MGLCASKKVYKFVIIGLDGSGKSSIFKRLVSNTFENSAHVPTASFNLAKVNLRKSKAAILCDLGGDYKIRILWRHHLSSGVSGIIFVLDASNPNRFEEARKELEKVFLDSTLSDNVPILIIGNKVDTKQVKTNFEIIEALQLKTVRNHEWTVRMTSAATGEGLSDAVDWLLNASS